jgi:hypothetical protein
MSEQLLLNEEQFRNIINQKDFTEHMLEIFESLDEPSLKVREQIEVLSMIVETYEKMVEDFCKVKEYYDMYNIIQAGK